MDKSIEKNNELAFFVTHFVSEPQADEGYVKLAFMTATPESLRKEIFYMGFGIHRGFSEADLKLKIIAGSLKKLPVPAKITKNKGLWMDVLRNVYIADKSDPFNDTDIRLVYNLQVAESYSDSKSIFSTVPEEAKLISSQSDTKVDIKHLYKSVFTPTSVNISIDKYAVVAMTT